MRVIPAPGLALRDPRTKQLVDPELGVEVDDHDGTFHWLIDRGDAVRLSDPDYAARQGKRDAADQAAAAPPADKPTGKSATPAADPSQGN